MNDNNGETAAPHISPFEAIRKESEEGGEYWTARDLAGVLEYDNYRNFLKVIAKARVACENSGQANLDHFVDIDEMVQIGSEAKIW